VSQLRGGQELSLHHVLPVTVKMRDWLNSTSKVASAVRITVLTRSVAGGRLLLALLASTCVIEMKRLKFTQVSGAPLTTRSQPVSCRCVKKTLIGEAGAVECMHLLCFRAGVSA